MMLIRSFVLAGAALCANAFLVIPEVEGNTVAPEVDPIQILDTKQQQITLRCTECPFREVEQDGKVSWTDGFETTLVRGMLQSKVACAVLTCRCSHSILLQKMAFCAPTAAESSLLLR